jgi:hypothetical protein
MNGFVNPLIFKYLLSYRGHGNSPDNSLTACVFIKILGSRGLCARPPALFRLIPKV